LRHRGVAAVAGNDAPSLSTLPPSSSLRSITCPMCGLITGS